jgi:AcrR family transcriptional regulator
MFQESLVELMADKPILNISIKELCARAGLSRSTFYTYYKDQYDLLRQIEEQATNGMNRIVEKCLASPTRKGKISPAEFEGMVQEMLKYVAENNDSIQVLLSKNGDSNFQKRFFRDNIENLRNLMELKGKEVPDEETLMCYSIFMTGGMVELIQDWLKNGMNITVQKMAKIVDSLVHEVLG